MNKDNESEKYSINTVEDLILYCNILKENHNKDLDSATNESMPCRGYFLGVIYCLDDIITKLKEMKNKNASN